MDSLQNKIKIAINNGWFLKIPFPVFIDLIDYLLPKKTYINIEIIISGKNLIKNLEINENTLVSDVYEEIWKKIKDKNCVELYEDNEGKHPLEYSNEKLCKRNKLYVLLYDINYDSWECLKTFQGHSKWVSSVAFSPDGRTLVSGSEDYTLKLWSVSSGECLKTFQEHSDSVFGVAFSPDGRTVVSGSEDFTLKLWSVSSGECLKTFEGYLDCVIISVAFSPDGRTIISGTSEMTLRLWSVSSGECLKTFEGHSHLVNTVAFSPDGRTVISCSNDKTLKLWGLPQ